MVYYTNITFWLDHSRFELFIIIYLVKSNTMIAAILHRRDIYDRMSTKDALHIGTRGLNNSEFQSTVFYKMFNKCRAF